MNILFICNQNLNRSKTAEELFKDQFNTKSAGLYNQKPVTEKQLSWADVVIVMEEGQRSEIAKRFPKRYMQKRIISFDIPDIYTYNHPKLIESLKSKFNEYLEILALA
ncbi:MAG: phosphotyrosine protein phosphatase [Nanoarchaeota archaeon]